MAKGRDARQLESEPPGRSREDALFNVLSAGRRRAVLSYLRAADTPVEFSALATEIAHRESQSEGVNVDREKWTDVRTALAHAHLPIMDDAGVVAYDEEAELVDLGENASLVWPQLDAIDEDDAEE